MPLKHTMPAFLEEVTSPEAYERWLERMAMAHVKRDRARGHSADGTQRSLYKEAIHAAVVLSGGRDAYTGEQLHWHLISKYNNDESKLGRHVYKAQFALLPSVDHGRRHRGELPHLRVAHQRCEKQPIDGGVCGDLQTRRCPRRF